LVVVRMPIRQLCLASWLVRTAAPVGFAHLFFAPGFPSTHQLKLCYHGTRLTVATVG